MVADIKINLTYGFILKILYLRKRLDEVLDNDEREIDINVPFMHLIHDDVSILIKEVLSLIHEALQEDTSSDE